MKSFLRLLVCPDDIFQTAQPFVIRLGMMVHDHKPENRAPPKTTTTTTTNKQTKNTKQQQQQNDWVASLQGHSHSEGSYSQNMTVPTISPELLI